jgi:hypothetical protein
MTSLHQHGAKEAQKQLHLRIKRSGLNTVKTSVTRKSGRLKVRFTGAPDEVKKVEQIFADFSGQTGNVLLAVSAEQPSKARGGFQPSHFRTRHVARH